MIRWLVALLVVVNGALWIWWQGYLGPFWDAPGQGDREPSRLARQVRPETVTVLAAGVRPAGVALPAPSVAASVAAPAASVPSGRAP